MTGSLLRLHTRTSFIKSDEVGCHHAIGTLHCILVSLERKMSNVIYNLSFFFFFLNALRTVRGVTEHRSFYSHMATVFVGVPNMYAGNGCMVNARGR